MSDLDDLDKHVNEIEQVFNRNGHSKFVGTFNLAELIRRKLSLHSYNPRRQKGKARLELFKEKLSKDDSLA